MIKSLVFLILLAVNSIAYSAQDILVSRKLTISLGGFPNFLYQIPYEDQVHNVVTDILKPLNIAVEVEYRPWKAIPKVITDLNYATVASIGAGGSIPTGYISSINFSIASSQSVALILKDSDDNRKFLSTFNYHLKLKMR